MLITASSSANNKIIMPDRAVNAARSGSFYVKMSLDQNIPVCYTAIDIKRTERGPDIKFFKKVGSAINTALIEEIGNQVQYFRIQAFVDGEWKTVYQSEKIQDMRLCSFDAVTTDRVRLSIDKFRDDAVPANIKSLKLYNEPKRNAEGFEVSAYQRLDGDTRQGRRICQKPCEVL